MTKVELEKKYESLYGIKPSKSLTKKQLELRISNANAFQKQDEIFKDVISKMYKSL